MAKKKAKAPTRPPEPQFPIVVETFRQYGMWELEDINRWKEPTCFNGLVRVKKFRVTIEQVEEPKEVVAARLLKLWRECDNHHHWEPLVKAAADIGYELPRDEYGKDRKPRT